MKVKIGVAFGDLHVPYHNETFVRLLKELVGDLKPDYLIYGGDMFDAYGISRFAKKDGYDEEQGVYDTHKEMIQFRDEIHKPLKKLCKKNADVLWLGGNHDEQRTRESIIKIPDRERMLSISQMFPDVKLTEYNKLDNIGKANFTHGIYVNDAHAKKHVIACTSNIFYFHTHTTQEYTKTSLLGKTFSGKGLGCGCDMNPEYMKNLPNSWIQTISVFYFFPDGSYNDYTIKVIKGKFYFNGKLYK